MAASPIELILSDASHVERPESQELRARALDLVRKAKNKTNIAQLPDILLELLTQVIRLLFSQEQHAKLTSTGRKNQVDQSLPAALEWFSSDSHFDSAKRPLWKNGWTPSLLKHVLSLYSGIEEELKRKILENHFHLLVPPILHQIDDIDILYKASGCRCLRLLCDELHHVNSKILKRSGLADVFVEALKNNFSYLPTLTSEDDSLMLYQALYPAFRSLLTARFSPASPGKVYESPSQSTKRNELNARRTVKPTKSEEELRQSYLTLLLRHQLLYSLSHLSTGVGSGSSTSLQLSIYFVSQFGWIFAEMGIATAIHLQTILPLLRNILSDPFGSASPEMLFETIKALRMIVQVSWPRIREKWWSECLRGVVNCWLNVVDDQQDEKTTERSQSFVSVKHELKIVACLLEDVVGSTFRITSKNLINEEPLLEQLFDGQV